MGRHSDAGPDTGTHLRSAAEWEEPAAPAPLWRTRIITSAALLLAVLAGTWWAVSWLTSPTGPGGPGAPQAAPVGDRPETPGDGGPPADTGTSPEAGSTEEAGEDGTVIVHVAGEVEEPGLVELPSGARVSEAIQAAGGPTDEAQLDRLNLAAEAVDASRVLVPGPDTPPGSAVAAGPGGTGSGGAGSGTAGAGTGGTGETVNLNTADLATLEQLPGIGPALAERIISHREQVGPFGSMADLDAVSGIGPAMLERLDGSVSW